MSGTAAPLKCAAGDVNCCELNDPTCNDGGDTGGGGDAGTIENVTVMLVNTTSAYQRFVPTGGSNTNDYAGTTIDRWDPGTIIVPPGQTLTYYGAFNAPYGSRLNLEALLLTDDPYVRSGQGYSVTMLATSKTCTVRTTGLAPPNGVTVSCN